MFDIYNCTRKIETYVQMFIIWYKFTTFLVRVELYRANLVRINRSASITSSFLLGLLVLKSFSLSHNQVPICFLPP